MPGELVGVKLSGCTLDIVEIAAQCGRSRDLASIASGRGLALPQFGRLVAADNQLALCVRCERWLLLAAPAPAAVSAALWHDACAGAGIAVDLSSGLVAFHLAGPAAREVLARSCRLDIDPVAFPVGHAAATILAQVSAILAALPSGLLLLTPATTARHFREGLTTTAKPFGMRPQSNLTIADLLGSKGA